MTWRKELRGSNERKKLDYLQLKNVSTVYSLCLNLNSIWLINTWIIQIERMTVIAPQRGFPWFPFEQTQTPIFVYMYNVFICIWIVYNMNEWMNIEITLLLVILFSEKHKQKKLSIPEIADPLNQIYANIIILICSAVHDADWKIYLAVVFDYGIWNISKTFIWHNRICYDQMIFYECSISRMSIEYVRDVDNILFTNCCTIQYPRNITTFE